MTEAWNLRAYHPDDCESFWSMRARAFPDQDQIRERRRWRWQFERNPFRPQHLSPGWVLEEEGQVRGFLGRIAVPVRRDGREVLGLAATDWCVDPDWQGQAAGLGLARRFLGDPDTEFPFATAPFPGSLPVWRYLGADVLAGTAEPCLWVNPVAESAVEGPNRALSVEEWDRFDARVDALAAAPRKRWRVFTWRDHRYLNWRYADYPFGRPRLLVAGATDDSIRGYLVLMEVAGTGQVHLPELMTAADDEEAVQALLARARDLARAARSTEMYLLHRDAWVHGLLPGCGFQAVADHGLGFFCRKAEGGPGLADWYFTAGDGDLLFSTDC